eukprot:CAMPEP_0113307086 /NCGR_PEP_ID=MMETSP0010_2-20120614/6079_1 /TAXON_ID=216773 ORGANISM="Corethron hystrix, Strain 308" /NCGR_SAMPLE_ID=MMETSP0010_2 /ASSEMBLY_ACC=CAM_ASM_000155 /LENGTH=726 /DNA_ID=CAMNT_0000161885 /DNA_START=652 /DNA_END=2832 /DNA_ORIENTATION=- /assembly_acc=CAM_ASM_000155
MGNQERVSGYDSNFHKGGIRIGGTGLRRESSRTKDKATENFRERNRQKLLLNTNTIQRNLENTTRPTNTTQPTMVPTRHPSPLVPSQVPSTTPSFSPSGDPSVHPSNYPTHPTSHPSDRPTNKPSDKPSSLPSMEPSFNSTSIVQGTYEWRLNGPCCPDGQWDTGKTEEIKTEILEAASIYSRLESGTDSDIIDVSVDLTDFGTELLPTPARSILEIKIIFKSRRVDVQESVKNVNNAQDYIYGFYKYFGTIKNETLAGLNKRYPNSPDYFKGGEFKLLAKDDYVPTSTPFRVPSGSELTSLPTRNQSNRAVKVKSIITIAVIVLVLLIALTVIMIKKRGKYKDHSSGGFNQAGFPMGNQPIHHQSPHVTDDHNRLSSYATGEEQENYAAGSDHNGLQSLNYSSHCESSINPDEYDAISEEIQPNRYDDFDDELDEYRDLDLEVMRKNVQSSVRDGDEMISEALTRALMDEDENSAYSGEERPDEEISDMVVEANTLCETIDWLKRNEEAHLEERRDYMQETLNKMVSYVRRKKIEPNSASHIVHGCAALLGLPLEKELPETTIIVLGMRKTTRVEKLRDVFNKLGDIEDVAVAQNERGFGVIRFKTPKSVKNVMKKYRNEEIVVADVAIVARELKLSSTTGIFPPELAGSLASAGSIQASTPGKKSEVENKKSNGNSQGSRSGNEFERRHRRQGSEGTQFSYDSSRPINVDNHVRAKLNNTQQLM